jgi:hypothetical protein
MWPLFKGKGRQRLVGSMDKTSRRKSKGERLGVRIIMPIVI